MSRGPEAIVRSAAAVASVKAELAERLRFRDAALTMRVLAGELAPDAAARELARIALDQAELPSDADVAPEAFDAHRQAAERLFAVIERRARNVTTWPRDRPAEEYRVFVRVSLHHLRNGYNDALLLDDDASTVLLEAESLLALTRGEADFDTAKSAFAGADQRIAVALASVERAAAARNATPAPAPPPVAAAPVTVPPVTAPPAVATAPRGPATPPRSTTTSRPPAGGTTAVITPPPAPPTPRGSTTPPSSSTVGRPPAGGANVVTAPPPAPPGPIPPRGSTTSSSSSTAGRPATGGTVITPPPVPAGPVVGALPGLACGHPLGPDIYAKWRALGEASGPLGCPVAHEIDASPSHFGTTGRIAFFGTVSEGALIVLHGSGPRRGQTFAVDGCRNKLYRDLLSTASPLGFPVTDEYDVQGGGRTDFEGGYMLRNLQTGQCLAYGNAAVTAPTAAAPTATGPTLVWLGKDADRVGPGNAPRPDGRPDAHFRVGLTLPQQVEIKSISLYQSDAAGNSSGQGHIWHTQTPSYWILGVFFKDRQLNPGGHGPTMNAFEGRFDLDLYAADAGSFVPGQFFTVEFVTADGRRLRQAARVP